MSRISLTESRGSTSTVAGPNSKIDHINMNRADNRMANLRLATNGENMQNTGPHADNSSGLKGVSWHRGAQKWMVQINARGVHYYLGLFDDPQKGHAAYCAAAERLHGEFARTA